MASATTQTRAGSPAAGAAVVFDARDKQTYTRGHATLRCRPDGSMYLSKTAVEKLGLEFPARLRFIHLPAKLISEKDKWFVVSCPSTDHHALKINKARSGNGADFTLVALAIRLLAGSPVPDGQLSVTWKFYPHPEMIDVAGMEGKQRAYQLIYPEPFDPQAAL